MENNPPVTNPTSPLEPPPGTTYEERFTALLSDEDSETKKSVTKRAVFQNRKSWIKRQIEESKLGKLWLHGKTREEMSSAEMDELWKHVNKLRTSGVSFENCEKITGLRKNCCRPGYKLWRDRNSAEVKALGEEFNRRIDHSFGLPSDEEERTKDEREETVFGDEFTDLDKYNELVDLYIQGEGKSMEEEIEKFKSQAQALDEIAAEKGVNLGIKWDVNSWTLDPNVGHPNNAEHTIGIKKTVRLSHRNELEKQIAEAKTTLQTLGIEFDTSKPDDSDGSFEPSESDEASEADEPYEPSKSNEDDGENTDAVITSSSSSKKRAGDDNIVTPPSKKTSPRSLSSPTPTPQAAAQSPPTPTPQAAAQSPLTPTPHTATPARQDVELKTTHGVYTSAGDWTMRGRDGTLWQKWMNS
ncbi:hypothetical protein GN958_ATG23331 [Phytophthora infestans]|uniref:Uncharacterized protein n=1 Tax=Phytophthora infestans TaxID=4787 RepID=A0A8S9TG92_PHYIN|nr:hypothetical protein GN958_ATG23331 [Phytophthora infestans]